MNFSSYWNITSCFNVKKNWMSLAIWVTNIICMISIRQYEESTLKISEPRQNVSLDTSIPVPSNQSSTPFSSHFYNLAQVLINSRFLCNLSMDFFHQSTEKIVTFSHLLWRCTIHQINKWKTASTNENKSGKFCKRKPNEQNYNQNENN